MKRVFPQRQSFAINTNQFNVNGWRDNRRSRQRVQRTWTRIYECEQIRMTAITIVIIVAGAIAAIL